MDKKTITATGRRKSAIAQIKMVPGKGNITVNGMDVNEYMPSPIDVMDLKQPLEVTNNVDVFDITVKATGGGKQGQAGAIRLAISKALLEYDKDTDQEREDSYRKILRANEFLTRDARIKERKKPGLKKARRAPQFSKR